MLVMSLAHRLSKARQDKGLSRRALSLDAGLSQSLVGQIERGDVSDTSSANLGALSRVQSPAVCAHTALLHECAASLPSDE
jgi:transcriptional regulator with XRE-family HTH domain